MSDLVELRYVREFPYPVERTYPWLTDFRDEDAHIAGAIVQKREIAREGGTLLMTSHNVNLGTLRKGTAEIHLFPDELRWEARLVRGPGKGSLYRYQLTPTASGGTRLEIRFGIRARTLGAKLRVTLGKPLLRREIHKMWGGFAAAMARDLADEDAPRAHA